MQNRLPQNHRALAAVHRAIHAETGADGFTHLTRRTARRAGGAFERAWLLQSLLGEIGVKAVMRTGELFDVIDRPRGPHAGVEATIDGQTRLVDPSSSQPVPETRAIRVRQLDQDGRPKRVPGLETLSGWVYLPH